MKKLSNLKGAQQLSKDEQQSINGGRDYCGASTGWDQCNDGSWCCGICKELGNQSLCIAPC